MAALARGQHQAPARSPASSSCLMKLRDALGFPCGSLSLNIAQFHRPTCVWNGEGIRRDENTLASLRAGFAPKKSKIKANGTFLSVVSPTTLRIQCSSPGRMLLFH